MCWKVTMFTTEKILMQAAAAARLGFISVCSLFPSLLWSVFSSLSLARHYSAASFLSSYYSVRDNACWSLFGHQSVKRSRWNCNGRPRRGRAALTRVLGAGRVNNRLYLYNTLIKTAPQPEPETRKQRQMRGTTLVLRFTSDCLPLFTLIFSPPRA